MCINVSLKKDKGITIVEELDKCLDQYENKRKDVWKYMLNNPEREVLMKHNY